MADESRAKQLLGVERQGAGVDGGTAGGKAGGMKLFLQNLRQWRRELRPLNMSRSEVWAACLKQVAAENKARAQELRQSNGE
jgi:hypothetical protein